MISARRAREADLDKASFSWLKAGAIYRRMAAHSRAEIGRQQAHMSSSAKADDSVFREAGCKAETFRSTGYPLSRGMTKMTIELHTWNTPNGRKISVALEEMELPYEVIPINITKGEQMAPDCLAISPNNKIPAIVDPEGPDGKRATRCFFRISPMSAAGTTR